MIPTQLPSAVVASALAGSVVVEGNRVENSDIGILVDAGCRNVLLRGNRMEGCLVPLQDDRKAGLE